MAQTNSQYKKIGIASLIMMGSVFLSRVIGLAREMVIAYLEGAKGSVDAYQIAFIIPEILNHVLATGFLSLTFIPIFTHYMSEGKEDEGWHVFSIIMTVFGGVLSALILISILFAPELVHLLAPKISNPDIFESAVSMTRIIIPAQIFFFAGGLFMAVQFSKEAFLFPAMAPVIYNLGIILGGILLSPYIGIKGFAWGVLAGSFFGNFFLQYIGAKKAGLVYRPSFQWKHPDLKKYIVLSLPLMFGFTVTFFSEIFFRFFGSYLPEGSIAKLNYSYRIMFLLVGFFGQAVGVATYPYLAKLVSENKMEQMNDLINNTMRYMSIVIPFTALLMVLRHEIVLVLFERGEFDAAATSLTAQITVFILLGAVAFSAQTIVTRGYYAMQNTWFPTIVSSFTVILCIPFIFFCMSSMGITGVALALSITAIVQVVVLFVLWNIRTKNQGSKTVYLFYGKVTIISIVIGVILEFSRRSFLSRFFPNTFAGSFITLAVIGALFVILLITVSYLFKIQEIHEVLNRIFVKLKLKKQG